MNLDQNLVSIDFKEVSSNEARLSVFDRGFLFGDSVYEVVRTYGSRMFHLERHFLRLQRSAEALGFSLPFDCAALREHLDLMVTRFVREDCFLRIVVTRGISEIGLCPQEEVTPTTVVIVGELPPWPEDYYTKGISLVVVGIRRNLRGALNPRIKSGNYLNNVLAIMEARQAGAVDAVMLNADGFVTESSTANIFMVRGGTLITPPEEAGILDGVSRFTVMDLACRERIPCETRLFGPEELHAAEECFLTSTTRDVMPVRRVDDFDIPSPGALTLRLMELFQEFSRNR